MVAPYTKTEFCSIAAGFFGEQPLSNIESPSTKEEAAWARTYDLVREDLLCAHNWNFATKLAVVTSTGIVPPHTWGYAYSLPAEFIRFISIEGREINRPEKWYEVVGRELYYDDATGGSININFIANITDLSLWQPNARMAFAKKLAKEMVFHYQKNNRTVERLEQEYLTALKVAVSTDTSERPPKRLDNSKAKNRRFSYTGYGGALDREVW